MDNVSDNKSSAELQREIDLQRMRVESTIDQIQEKLSPGQLVDELLAYGKGGGGEFVASLQRNVTANPLPVALLGVSLAWLMARPATAKENSADADRHFDDSVNTRRGYSSVKGDYDDNSDYPVMVINGHGLQRIVKSTGEHGNAFSEFVDDAGRKFKAMSDERGNRAGHFVDETGKSFKGFTNATGDRIEQFRDEAGNLLDEATGWASHSWQKARETLNEARETLSSATGAGLANASHAGDAVRGQMENLNQTILHQFRDQPLVGGALAFALGAALASTLPHTPQEDALMGRAADALREKVEESASDMYQQGKEKAADIYASAAEKVGNVYQHAKDGVAEASSSSQSGTNSGGAT